MKFAPCKMAILPFKNNDFCGSPTPNAYELPLLDFDAIAAATVSNFHLN